MKNKSYWNISIGVSFFMHSFIFVAFFPVISMNVPNEKKEIKEIKIIVQEVRPKEKTSSMVTQTQFNQKNSTPPPPYIKNVMRKLMGDDKERPSLEKPQIFEKNTTEVIISDKLENESLKNNPSYMSYYNGIRTKLDRACNKNYAGKGNGNVSLSFVLSRDGRLERIRGEGDSQELIDVAIKSVKESLPFLPFPAELKDQTYQFHVSILFKNN